MKNLEIAHKHFSDKRKEFMKDDTFKIEDEFVISDMVEKTWSNQKIGIYQSEFWSNKQGNFLY